jgi:hypothetical protein
MERIGTLLVAPSTERKAEPGRFGAALKNAAGEVASGIAGSVALAAPFVPGGAVLAGALRVAARPALTSTALAGAGAYPSTGAATGSGGGDVIEATRALQSEAQSFNLQYLQLQEAMQRESREFTSLTRARSVPDTAVRLDGASALSRRPTMLAGSLSPPRRPGALRALAPGGLLFFRQPLAFACLPERVLRPHRLGRRRIEPPRRHPEQALDEGVPGLIRELPKPGRLCSKGLPVREEAHLRTCLATMAAAWSASRSIASAWAM